MLRHRDTGPELFRRMATRISVLLAAEALRDLPTAPATVPTPMGEASGLRLAADVVVVPVLRAGLGMLDAVLELLPTARVGHIGLQRDELTAVASQYYSKLPRDLEHSHVLMIDPMLATGGSAVAGAAVCSGGRAPATSGSCASSPRPRASPSWNGNTRTFASTRPSSTAGSTSASSSCRASATSATACTARCKTRTVEDTMARQTESAHDRPRARTPSGAGGRASATTCAGARRSRASSRTRSRSGATRWTS